MKSKPLDKWLIIGDLNSRFGESRRQLIEGKVLPEGTGYTSPADKIKQPNSNARFILSALKDTIILNSLATKTKTFSNDMTYRQGKRWTSELDCATVTPGLLPAIADFRVLQAADLPSDHAPISVSIDTARIPGASGHGISETQRRASSLGTYDENRRAHSLTQIRRPIRMEHIDSNRAKTALSVLNTPQAQGQTVENLIADVNSSLYACLNTCRQAPANSQQWRSGIPTHERWNSLLEADDPKAIWKAINWSGCIQIDQHAEQPTDEEFRSHFESLLNPQPCARLVVNGQTYLPITDDPIQPQEVQAVLNALKSNKSGGLSGIPPGALKLLPPDWTIFLTHLFNAILLSRQYPSEWSMSKLITLFKKGTRSSCDNYRGIALMDSIAKTYDAVLNRRLNLWFQPDREQAGAQKGRGCTEHLLTLRLLIDLARKKRETLYLVFVDFSKAYDRVPRNAMLEEMEKLGCGSAMLNAIASAYSDTRMILRSASISTSCGVRQGSPTSCTLFTLFVNRLIRNLKDQCQPDGFLQWLHCLMLMDDTILLATTRTSALQKIRIMSAFCRSSGMKVNEKKTQFMVIGGKEDDRTLFVVDGLTIRNVDSYTYLGSVVTQDASIPSSVKAHCRSKAAHAIKFEAFAKKNTDMPFVIKKKVFDAALSSAILYASETWISQGAWREAAPLYAACVRTLLGVRKTTATDLCLIEAGVQPLQQRIKQAQKQRFGKLIQEREETPDDPLTHALALSRQARTPGARYIDAVSSYSAEADAIALRERILSTDRTKFTTFRTLMNPDLSVHSVYTDPTIPEHKRIAFSKVRLSSHNLEIEKGRWTRKSREERLCTCGAVQDEPHIAAHCPSTAAIRLQHPLMDFSMPELFSHHSNNELVSVMYKLFSSYV